MLIDNENNHKLHPPAWNFELLAAAAATTSKTWQLCFLIQDTLNLGRFLSLQAQTQQPIYFREMIYLITSKVQRAACLSVTSWQNETMVQTDGLLSDLFELAQCACTFTLTHTHTQSWSFCKPNTTAQMCWLSVNEVYCWKLRVRDVRRH